MEQKAGGEEPPRGARRLELTIIYRNGASRPRKEFSYISCTLNGDEGGRDDDEEFVIYLYKVDQALT
jgi:hypothetical protein